MGNRTKNVRRRSAIPKISRKGSGLSKEWLLNLTETQARKLHDLEIEIADMLEENWRLRIRLALFAQFGIKRLPTAVELESWPLAEQIQFLVCYSLTTQRPWVGTFELGAL
jgi:hypothetical protein